MKRVLCVIVLMAFSHWTFSQSDATEKLFQSASRFMQLKHPASSLASVEAIPGPGSETYGWLLRFRPSGFMMVSSSQKVTPVLGYSISGFFDLSVAEQQIFLRYLTKDIENRKTAWEMMTNQDRDRVTASWNRFLSEISDSTIFQQWPPEGTTSTQGWLSTNWTQTAPYNAMCPMDLNAGARSVVGCPATAMAQILNFHRKIHHTRLDDSDDYYHSYGAGNSYWIDDDYIARDFPCFDSLNVYLAAIEDIWLNGGTFTSKLKAALSFACGVTAHQVYTSSVSGTFGLEQALMSFQRFGYTSSQLIYPEDTTLNSRIAEDIKVARPVQLGLLIDGGGGGHNVVVDGYNTDEFYHFNFGWGGSANGWYTLPPTSIPYNLTIIEGAVLDIIPVIGVGVDPVSGDEKGAVLFPNPLVNELCISGLTAPGTITIFDQSGKVVLSECVDIPATRIDVAPLLSGSYFFRLEMNGAIIRTGVLVKTVQRP